MFSAFGIYARNASSMLAVIYLIPVACNVCTYCNIAFYLKCILAHTRAKSDIRDMLIAHQQPHV